MFELIMHVIIDGDKGTLEITDAVDVPVDLSKTDSIGEVVNTENLGFCILEKRHPEIGSFESVQSEDSLEIEIRSWSSREDFESDMGKSFRPGCQVL